MDNPSTVPQALEPNAPRHSDPSWLRPMLSNPTYQEQASEIAHLRGQIQELGRIRMDLEVSVQMNSWTNHAMDHKVAMLKQKIEKDNEEHEFFRLKAVYFESCYKEIKVKFDALEQKSKEDLEALEKAKKENEDLKRQLADSRNMSPIASSSPTNCQPLPSTSSIPSIGQLSTASTSSDAFYTDTITLEGAAAQQVQNSSITTTSTLVDAPQNSPDSDARAEAPDYTMPVLMAQAPILPKAKSYIQLDDEDESDDDVQVLEEPIPLKNFEQIRKEYEEERGQEKYNVVPGMDLTSYLFNPNGIPEGPQTVRKATNPFTLFVADRVCSAKACSIPAASRNHNETWRQLSAQDRLVWRDQWTKVQQAVRIQLAKGWIVLKGSPGEKRKAAAAAAANPKKKMRV